jgi:hypothetical protein
MRVNRVDWRINVPEVWAIVYLGHATNDLEGYTGAQSTECYTDGALAIEGSRRYGMVGQDREGDVGMCDWKCVSLGGERVMREEEGIG